MKNQKFKFQIECELELDYDINGMHPIPKFSVYGVLLNAVQQRFAENVLENIIEDLEDCVMELALENEFKF